MFVLDTNTVIYFFKGMGGVAETLLATPPAEIALPSVVVYQVETGILKSDQPEKRSRQLAELIDTSRLLPFDRACAREAALIRADLETRGTPIGPLDTLIAATAKAARATLVTHNTREFKRVPGLMTVDWFTPPFEEN